MSLQCALGNYDVMLVKNDVVLRTADAQIQRIEYGRVNDNISIAQVTFIAAGTDCCAQLGLVDHWNTDLVIFDADTQEVWWRGPVRRVEYRRNVVQVFASDNLAWTQVRIVEGPQDFVDMDLSDIFDDMWQENVIALGGPTTQTVKYPSGVTQTRKIPASTNRRMWSITQEMLDVGLDVTTFGEYTLIGMPPTDPIVLTDEDVQGDVAIIKDGDDFANRVLVDVAKGIEGVYPGGGRVGGVNGYPLVELLMEDGTLQDQQSAQNTAKSRYDFSASGIRRVRADGGLILLPQSGLDPRRLIAGQMVTFTASQTCYRATETLRLGRIGFVIESGRETVTIDLQPLGAVEGLADL